MYAFSFLEGGEVVVNQGIGSGQVVIQGGTGGTGGGSGGVGGGALFVQPNNVSVSSIVFKVGDFNFVFDGVAGGTLSVKDSSGAWSAAQTFSSSNTFVSTNVFQTSILIGTDVFRGGKLTIVGYSTKTPIMTISTDTTRLYEFNTSSLVINVRSGVDITGLLTANSGLNVWANTFFGGSGFNEFSNAGNENNNGVVASFSDARSSYEIGFKPRSDTVSNQPAFFRSSYGIRFEGGNVLYGDGTKDSQITISTFGRVFVGEVSNSAGNPDDPNVINQFTVYGGTSAFLVNQFLIGSTSGSAFVFITTNPFSGRSILTISTESSQGFKLFDLTIGSFSVNTETFTIRGVNYVFPTAVCTNGQVWQFGNNGLINCAAMAEGGGGGGALFVQPNNLSVSSIVFRATDFNFVSDGVAGGTMTVKDSSGAWTAAQTFVSSTTLSSSTIVIGGMTYFFQSTQPAAGDQILHRIGASSFTYWGGDGTGSGSGVTYAEFATHESTTASKIYNLNVFTSTSDEKGAQRVQNGAITFFDEASGPPIGNANAVVCAGAGITCTQSAATTTLTIPGFNTRASLAVGTGSIAAMNVISSPTWAVVIDSGIGTAKLVTGATAFVSIGTNAISGLATIPYSAVLRYSSATGIAMWDTPHPRELYWNGASLLSLSTSNSPNVAPVVKTTATYGDVMGASYDDTLEECRGASFIVPEYANTFSTPTFTAFWFPSNKGGVTGNVVWDVKYGSGVTDSNSWNMPVTTATAGTSAGYAGFAKESRITWSPPGVGIRSGHGSMASMCWDPLSEVNFLVCREGGNASDNLVGDSVLKSFMISVPMR
jgi:hypothetical protein